MTAVALAASVVLEGLAARGVEGNSLADASDLSVWEAADSTSAALYARSEGHRVEILSSRTETSATYVNPNGSYTLETMTQPVRTLQDDGWVPVDTTLVSDANGVHPRAVPGEVMFSAGGDASLATVIGEGATAGLRWFATLPTPTLSGDSATYRNVAPNVDLTLTATRVGFEVSFVLKTRPANPKAVYRLPLGSGLTAEASDASGVMVLTDGNGHRRGFVRPTVMYDAQRDSSTGRPIHTGSLTAAITAAGHEIQVTPQAGFLTDPGTVYPVTIDPSLHLGQLNDLWIASSNNTAGSASQELRVGYVNGPSGALYRSFMKFDISSIAGAQISDAALALRQWSAPNCSARESRIYALGGPFTDATTWQTQPPVASATVYGSTTQVFGATGCAAGWVRYNTTTLAQKWASGEMTNYGLLVRAGTESDTSAFWRHYGMDYSDWTQLPSLAVTYTPPPTATAPYPPSTATTRTTTPTLSTQYDAPTGAAGAVRYEVYDSGHATLVTSGLGSTVVSGHRSSWTVPAGLLAGGTTYSWRAQPQGTATWTDYADLGIDPVNGDTLPASAPLPSAPSEVNVVAADGGAWITWGDADPGPDAQIDHYEITATTSGATATFIASADKRSMSASSLQNGTTYQWSIKAVSIYGSGSSIAGGTTTGAAVPSGPLAFQSIAQSYLTARSRLLTGASANPQGAADSTTDAAAIGEELEATGGEDISTRSYLAKSGIAYTSYAVTFSDTAVYWTPNSSPQGITLQTTADETLNQTAGGVSTDPELRSSRYTFTFKNSDSAWVINDVTQPSEPEDTTPDVEVDANEAPSESPVPLATNPDGTFTTNPESTQPQAPSGTLDYYAIASYVHRYYATDRYNPAYVKYNGNDCANFASQALYAGHRPMRGGLYINASAWYYNGWVKKASLTWGGVNNLFMHLWWTRTSYLKYTSDAAVGDLLFWDSWGDGSVNHVSIVVRRIGKTVYYGQHTTNYDNRTVETGMRYSPSGTKVYAFRIVG